MDGRLKRLLLTGFLFLIAVMAARFYVVGRAYSATALHALERRGDITEHERTTIAIFDRVSPATGDLLCLYPRSGSAVLSRSVVAQLRARRKALRH